MFESTESEEVIPDPTPEPSEEVELQIPDALSYLRESLPKSIISSKSSKTETGESIEDPDDLDERRMLQ
jgi:hypothetical protein